MVMGMPHFHGENLVEFRVWCVIVHWQGFAYTKRINVLAPWQAEAF